MLWSYINSAIRRYKLSSLTYIIANLGLAVGLVCVLLISYYVSNQLSYDRHLINAENLYRLDTAETYPGRQPLNIARAPGPVGLALLEQIPGVEAVTRGFVGDVRLELSNQKTPEKSLIVDPNFLSEVQLQILDGDRAQALSSPSNIVVTRDTALKYFGRLDVVGERLTGYRLADTDYRITAVIENLPENSHMDFDVLLPLEGYFSEAEIRRIRDAWGGAYFHTYVRLADGISPIDVEAKIPDFVDRNLPETLARLLSVPPHEFFRFSLVRVRDIHFYGAPLASMKPTGNLDTIRNLIIVSVMTMIIAAFNFTILATTQATLRTKEVAMRKTLGARKGQISAQFLGETFFQALLAGLLAAGLAELLIPIAEAKLGPIFGDYPIRGGIFFLWLLGLVIVTALVSGWYPSLLLSRLRPASIFNPAGNTPLRANTVRGAMVLVQIVITAVLVTVGLTMLMQQRFIKTQETGFDAAQMMILRLPNADELGDHVRPFYDRLAASPSVRNAAISSAVPGDGSEANIGLVVAGADKPAIVGFHRVSETFLEAYSVDTRAGRHFSKDYGADASIISGLDDQDIVPVIVNLAAAESLGYRLPEDAIGRVHSSSRGDQYSIVGVVPDIRFRSLKEPARPEIFMLSRVPGSVVSVKYEPGERSQALAQIESVWRESYPNYPIQLDYLTDLLRTLYIIEDRTTNLIVGFSVVAMVLSCVGLIAMLSFSISQQSRELAMRRLYGATTRNILVIYVSRFFPPLLVANIVSWPVSFYFLDDWLSGFETRISLGVTPFAISLLGSVLLAALLLLSHIGRINTARPATVLRRS